MLNIADPTLCLWEPAPFLIFSGNIWGNFIYYSHLFPSISALLIAIFVFWHNPKGKVNIALLVLSSTFTVWCLMDLVLWASERSDIIMFFWSSLIFFDLLIYVASFYFIHAFITNAWPSWKHDAFLALLFLPLILLAHTPYNLIAFDFTNCWREALEGPLWQYYVYNAEILISIWILIFAIKHFFKSKDAVKKREIVYVTLGILLFLISFSLGNILGSIETNWEIGQYGLFGMPVFVTFLTYLIVRYQTFSAKMIAAEALIMGLGILITSLLFIRKIENVFAIALITLALTTVLGILLIRSVRREVSQRRQIEQLVENLELANTRLLKLDKMKSEFVSIASHQLRSPLTAIRGYISMLLEGSYGKLGVRATETLEKIADSSRLMALSVEDYLNVSRIESGNMKYEYSDVDIKKLASEVVDDLLPVAIKSGLLLTFKSDVMANCLSRVDIGKTKQIIQNLVDNAIKYTPEGSIKVFVHTDIKNQLVLVDVIDSGIGMNKETQNSVFEKFERSNNANKVNVTGTGLGLYIARTMAKAMKGDVKVSSNGEGKGSTFTLKLPLI